MLKAIAEPRKELADSAPKMIQRKINPLSLIHISLLRVEQAVGDALAGLERDERAGVAAAEIALVGGVAVKDGGLSLIHI